MARTIARPSSLKLRDAVAYTVLALCAGIGLLVLIFGEQVNTLF